MHVTVSIIIPTYNRLDLLRQSVNSVIKQSWKDWELIIVDDGSTDETIEYLNSLNEPKIHLIPLSHSGNVARARNAGAKIACGKYIAFLDSDDLWEPDKLTIQLSALQENNAQWCCTFYDHIDKAGETIVTDLGRPTNYYGVMTSQILSTTIAVSISSILVENKLFENSGSFDENPLLNLREDYDLVLRLSLLAPLLIIPTILAHVREHPGRSTHACTDAYERMARVYEKFYHLTADINLKRIAHKRKAKHLMKASVINLKKGNLKRSLINLVKII